jgi:DNA modification methylase
MKGGHGVYCLPLPFPPPTRGREASGDSKCAVPGHPTQKPVALCAWWMTRAKVPTDGLVADPYAGSGSTGVAALASGRSFWGCEIEERYAEVAARRLEQAEHDGQQVGMFGPPP